MQSLRQSILVRAPPEAVQRALLDAESLAKLLGLPCRQSDQPGGGFELWDGLVSGANAYVKPGELTQLWRYKMPEWPADVESHLTLRFAPEPSVAGTRVSLEQEGIPEGCGYVVEEHWRDHVWPGLKALLEQPVRQDVGGRTWLSRRRQPAGETFRAKGR